MRCICGKDAAKKCGQCGRPYCSVDCQVKDWEVHKKFCKLLVPPGEDSTRELCYVVTQAIYNSVWGRPDKWLRSGTPAEQIKAMCSRGRLELSGARLVQLMLLPRIPDSKKLRLRCGDAAACHLLATRAKVAVFLIRPVPRCAVKSRLLVCQTQWVMELGGRYMGYTPVGLMWETKDNWAIALAALMLQELATMPKPPRSYAERAAQLAKGALQKPANWEFVPSGDVTGLE